MESVPPSARWIRPLPWTWTSNSATGSCTQAISSPLPLSAPCSISPHEPDGTTTASKPSNAPITCVAMARRGAVARVVGRLTATDLQRRNLDREDGIFQQLHRGEADGGPEQID